MSGQSSKTSQVKFSQVWCVVERDETSLCVISCILSTWLFYFFMYYVLMCIMWSQHYSPEWLTAFYSFDKEVSFDITAEFSRFRSTDTYLCSICPFFITTKYFSLRSNILNGPSWFFWNGERWASLIMNINWASISDWGSFKIELRVCVFVGVAQIFLKVFRSFFYIFALVVGICRFVIYFG